uniref:Transmembrane protein 106A n=1 Tax=Amphilophus citrinellus TaxID=61819 RepID=A0A3Q0S2I8_AMPCI
MSENKVRTLLHFPPYGAMDENPTGDTCPTCRGTGKIPREHEDQLVAVIPCNDVRLKPRHTKLYVCISMALCLFVCCLILFFLFPRSVTLTPVSVLSVMVYFMPDKVEIEVTNLINITNDNYYPVEIVNFSIQPVVAQIAIEKTKISNTTAMQPRSQKSHIISKSPSFLFICLTSLHVNFFIPFSSYCKSTSFKIHTLFLELQMTMNISYLSHTEQLSVDTFEYIDCGTNSTTPHPVSS